MSESSDDWRNQRDRKREQLNRARAKALMIRCPSCGAPPQSDCNDQGGVCLERTTTADRATGLEESACRSCGAPIIWVVMYPSGKRMPLNAETLPRFVITDGVAMMRDTYVSHFATCPNAAQHRKPKQQGGV